MKTVFKFTFFVLLGISALGFLITGFLYIFAPDAAELAESSEEIAPVSDSRDDEVSAPTGVSDSDQETAPTDEIIETGVQPEQGSTAVEAAEVQSEQEAVAEGETEEIAPPPVVKQVDWDLTPAEQGLAVGDWISIEGYQDDLIGATVEKHAATRVLKWNEPSDLFGTNGMVEMTSQSTGLPASEDRIISVAGLVGNPRENETIVQINETLLWEQTLLIRVTGQIDQIVRDKTPKRWTVFLKKGVHVDFAEPQNVQNDSQ